MWILGPVWWGSVLVLGNSSGEPFFKELFVNSQKMWFFAKLELDKLSRLTVQYGYKMRADMVGRQNRRGSFGETRDDERALRI